MSSPSIKNWISILASLVLAFFYVAYLELKGDDSTDGYNSEGAKKGGAHDKKKSEGVPECIISPFTAIPITLNNLVGGGAGGAAGILPLVGGVCALVAYYMTIFL